MVSFSDYLEVKSLSLDEILEVRIAGSYPHWVSQIVKELSLKTGGASVTEGTGGWVDSDGVYSTEPSTLISVNCVDAEAVLDHILPHLVSYVLSTHQESLWLRLNNKVFIVDRITLHQCLAGLPTYEELQHETN